MRSGSGPAGMISESTCTKCSSAANFSAIAHAYRTARCEWGLKSVGARILLISITRCTPLALSASASSLAADQALEPLAKLAGDRPGPARAERAAVALDHGDQLGGGAGEEAFLGRVHIVPVHRPLDDGVPRFSRQLDDRVAGDPLEDARVDRRRVDGPLRHDEDVI